MELLLVGLISKYPIAMTILLIMGIARAVFKPLFALAQAYVDATPTPNDNAFLDRVRENKIVKGLEFVLDWAGSIKLPKKVDKLE